jgi:L,D-peptidoglycan transpeptidase YkuD (ErfK/YbiS/YcfS/YnhG family)
MIRFYCFLLVLSLAVAPQTGAAEAVCPESLKAVKRLLIVIAKDMDAKTAVVRAYERSSIDGDWKKASGPKSASLGRHGLGWGWDQSALAAEGEPVKHEGDGRTPAGVFAIGHAFGFAANGPGADYMRLQNGKTYCVDDVRSDHYNKIVPKSEAGEGISGEDMGSIPLYRRGLLLSFPTNRDKRGGSCIFLHVWRAPASPTSGCVALREDDIAEIQTWASKESALAVILPQKALARLHECLPEL